MHHAQFMNNGFLCKRDIAYGIIFSTIMIGLTMFPSGEEPLWESWLIDFCTASLFTLLVYLTAHLARTDRTIVSVIITAGFILFFCPREEMFFARTEASLAELSSQCIVPFFISQYNRVSQKDFHRWYLLMLLMGIFCSYTHNGITIPLCCTFIWLAFQRRERFFRQACWPMVIGVIIGTGLSIWSIRNESLSMVTSLTVITSVTSIALKTLWETKIFVISILLTIYFSATRQRRKIMLYTFRRHYVLTLCCLFSLITLSFAPLGIQNAITGVSFFSMFWVLFLCQHLSEIYLKHKI